MEVIDYHKRPEWSYSQMKVILDSGIDYAVAAKNGLIPGPSGRAIDLGELAHAFVLNKSMKDQFVLSPYEDFRTKEARDWKTKQIEEGKTIVTTADYDFISSIVDNIESHPMSKELIASKKALHEQELFATVDGIKLRGKADSMVKTKDKLIITDIKTTGQFDEWKYKSHRRHYDLQAAVYSLIASNAYKLGGVDSVDFYFCVVETKAPFRVQYHKAGKEFVNHGLTKLEDCLRRIKEFGDATPQFLIAEVNDLSDWTSY